MKTTDRAAIAFVVVVAAVTLLQTVAKAQGCGLAPSDEFQVNCTGNNCSETQIASDCSGFGSPDEYCSLGYGECCDTQFTEANAYLDGSCNLGPAKVKPKLTFLERNGFSENHYHPRVFIASGCEKAGIHTAEAVFSNAPTQKAARSASSTVLSWRKIE